MEHDAEGPAAQHVPEDADLHTQIVTLQTQLDNEREARKCAEAGLARERRLTEALFAHTPLALQMYSSNGTSLGMNEVQRRMLGLPDSTTGVGQFNILTDPPAITSGLHDAFQRAYAGEVVQLQGCMLNLDAPENHWHSTRAHRWYNQTIVPVCDEQGAVEAVLSMVEDVTPVHETGAVLKRTTELLEGLFTYAPLALQIFDHDGTSLRMNETHRRLLGLPSVTIGVGQFNVLTDPLSIANGSAELFARAYAGEIVEVPEFSANFDDPNNRWPTGRHAVVISQILFPIHDDEGAVTAVVSCALDISARKVAEQALQQLNTRLESLVAERTAALAQLVARLKQEIEERRQVEATLRASEERHRALVQAIPDMLFRLNRAGVLLDIHALDVENLFVPPAEALNHALDELFDPDLVTLFMESIRTALDTGAVQTLEYVLLIEAVPHFFEARILRSGPDEVFAVVRDVTARRESEEARRRLEYRLQEKQRLESLGVLAGGIAHDFNNILTAVLGHAEIAHDDPACTAELHAHLNAIIASTRRAVALTGQMLAYAGRGRMAVKPMQLGMLIREMASLFTTVANQHIEIRYQLADNNVIIEGDIVQVRQVVLNVFTNAAEALHERGGTITLATAVEDLNRARLDQLIGGGEASPGRYVGLTITDTGDGMDRATLVRIFEPFFTTRFMGRGLGLAAVYGIVRGHSGVMYVESEPGRGTTFQIWFPATPVSSVVMPRVPVASARTRRGTLLVVDDEESVRLVVSRLLENAGYSVKTAGDGATALARLRAGIPELVGVLLDLTMPGIPSEEVAAEVRATCPGVPIILMSGYSSETLAECQVSLGATAWVQKPFSRDILLAALSQGGAGAPLGA